MKAVILAGGQGTRMGEETQLRPKPLVEVGGRPIVWHILKLYQHYGFNDFIICAGYAGEMPTRCSTLEPVSGNPRTGQSSGTVRPAPDNG